MTSTLSDRPIRLFSVTLLAVVVSAAALRVLWGNDLATVGDFFALWTYPVVARLHGAAVLYDLRSLHEAQVALGMPQSDLNPFPYPPTFLLILWPLGALHFVWASRLWMATTLSLYLAAVAWKVPNGRLAAFSAVVVPSTVVTLIFGQSGFLSAALMIGGIRLAWSRPLLAGVLLGLLSYKPQLGFLVPVALASAGLWTCMLAAAVTVMMLVLATSAAFGWTIWLIWLKALPAHTRLYDLDFAHYDLISPTVTANLQLLGAPGWLVSSGQILAAICAAAVVWWSFRRRSREAALLTLCAATFLATPHALFYDLTMLAGSIVFYRAKHPQVVDALSPGKKTALLAALWLPIVVLSRLHLPLSSGVLVGVLWVAWQESPEAFRIIRPLSVRLAFGDARS